MLGSRRLVIVLQTVKIRKQFLDGLIFHLFLCQNVLIRFGFGIQNGKFHHIGKHRADRHPRVRRGQLVPQRDPHIVLRIGQGHHFVQKALHQPHIVRRVQRHGMHADVSLFPHFHHRDRFFLIDLGKGILHQRTGVAQGLPGAFLRLMDMSQRHVIKIGKDGCVDIVQPAQGLFFGIGNFRAGNELMADQHVPLGRIHRRMPQHRLHRVLIGFDLLVRIKLPNLHGLQKRQQTDHDLPVTVLKRHLLQAPVKGFADVHARLFQQGRKIGNALGGIMIAADDEHP